ncbi:MAG: RNA methyltransferase [Patescibacteria group bacterium]
MANHNVTAVLYNIRSAHNVGSMFRTADAAGINKIYLCGYTPIPEPRGKKRGSDKIAKTALGAEKSVSWEYVPRVGKLLDKLTDEGIQIIALEQAKGSKGVFKFKPKRSLALVVGNEVKGLPVSILKRVDDIVEIPMRGKKESLNVSVAFGIAAYALI